MPPREGVGWLLCQLARHLGAIVIGTVAKAELAHRAGCAYTILYPQENFDKRARKADVATSHSGRKEPVYSRTCTATKHTRSSASAEFDPIRAVAPSASDARYGLELPIDGCGNPQR
jgi:hypothetical protein